MRNSVSTTIAAGVLLALAGAAQAATKSDSFLVSATVAKNCIIDAPDLTFPDFDGATDVVANSTISVRCTIGTTFDVDLSTGSSTSYALRTLRNGPDLLNYNLYADAGYTTIWGNNTGGSGRPATGTGAGMGLPQAQLLRVYGRLRGSDNTGPVPAALYTDNIVATITY